ncbi:MAG: hypothetical protein WD894_04950 [Pirellulales bacterium]
MNRFHSFHEGELGRALIDQAAKLEISVYRHDNEVCMEYQLSGCLDANLDDDGGGGAGVSTASDFAFLLELLSTFSRPKKP